MKALRLLMCVGVAYSGVSVSPASPPTQVGDSFLNLTSSFRGFFTNDIFYLEKDGSCKQLFGEFIVGARAQPTYEQSQAGTYTYVPTQGNPSEATFTINLPGTSSAYVLEFTTDTSGNVSVPLAQATFTFLLASQNTFLTNVSDRVTLRQADTAITGFVIEGSKSRLVLIRTIGPTLALFGVSPVSAKPKLNLFSGTRADQIASGQPWGSVTGFDVQAMSWIFGIAGAFELQAGSNDVIYFGLVSPGVYTAQASDTTTGAAGASALTEVYILPYSG